MTDIIKMECGLPTNMNDPRMEYALELAYRIDVEIDENGCGFLGTLDKHLLSRLRQNVIDPAVYVGGFLRQYGYYRHD